jgi:acyl carrier protein
MNELTQKIIETVSQLTTVNINDLDEKSQVGRVDGWDSITHLNLMVSLGQEFNFEVDATVLSEVQSIKDIVTLIDTDH